MRPTIVLVHGAFAESASWDGVIDPLVSAGHPVIAAVNPLRGVASDAAAVSDLVRSIDGPVVLVGHSYGGSVISNVAADSGEITALVFVAAFAPDAGESARTLSARFPGSTLGDALRAVPRSDGTTDLLIVHDRFHHQVCADVPAPWPPAWPRRTWPSPLRTLSSNRTSVAHSLSRPRRAGRVSLDGMTGSSLDGRASPPPRTARAPGAGGTC